MATCTPLDLGDLLVEWTIPRFVAKFFFGSTITQVERDVPIWNNKTYLPQPTVIKEVNTRLSF